MIKKSSSINDNFWTQAAAHHYSDGERGCMTMILTIIVIIGVLAMFAVCILSLAAM